MARARIVGLTKLTLGKRVILFSIILLRLKLGMPTTLLLSIGRKTLIAENAMLQNRNHPKSPGSLLLVMIIPIWVPRPSKSEDVNLPVKLNQRTVWM